jgi:hypothetical protein
MGAPSFLDSVALPPALDGVVDEPLLFPPQAASDITRAKTTFFMGSFQTACSSGKVSER